jgi:hypothetical protein
MRARRRGLHGTSQEHAIKAEVAVEEIERLYIESQRHPLGACGYNLRHLANLQHTLGLADANLQGAFRAGTDVAKVKALRERRNSVAAKIDAYYRKFTDRCLVEK